MLNKNKSICKTNLATLLSFAHIQEASFFFKSFNFLPYKLNLPSRSGLKIYSNSEHSLFLAITKEGLINTLDSLTLLISKLELEDIFFSKIINLGLVGSLNEKLSIGQCFEVSHSIYQKGHPKKGLDLEFHSYQSQILTNTDKFKILTCVSCVERVKNKNDAKVLSSVGDIVDRELWGVAHVSHLFNIPWASIKVISDSPIISNDEQSEEKCQQIKIESEKYSKLLFNYYNEHFLAPIELPLKDEDISEEIISEFYFTESMKRSFRSYLAELKIQTNLNYRELLLTFISKTREKKLKHKEQGLYFLNLCADHLNPYQAKLKKELLKIKKGKINLEWSHDFEKLLIKCEVNTHSDLLIALEDFKSISNSNIEQLLSGDFFKNE